MTDLIQTERAGYAKSNAALVNVDPNALESYKRKKLQNRRVNILEAKVQELEKKIEFLMEKING